MEDNRIESFIQNSLNNIIKKLNVYAYSSNNVFTEKALLEDFDKLVKEFKRDLSLLYPDPRIKINVKIKLGDPILYTIEPENNFTLFLLNGYGYDFLKDVIIEADSISERYYIDNMGVLYDLVLSNGNKKFIFKKEEDEKRFQSGFLPK